MKKTITFILCLVSVLAAKAQTSSGNMMVGGSFGYDSYKDDDNDQKRSTISFSPSFGYFVADNFAVGASIGVSKTTNETGATEVESSSFSFGPFVRYYKYTANENFAFFGEAGITYGTGKTDNAGGDLKTSVFAFDVSPGFAYFLTDHWAIDFSLSLLSITSFDPNTDNGNDKITNVSFGVSSFNPTLGFRYHFGQ